MENAPELSSGSPWCDKKAKNLGYKNIAEGWFMHKLLIGNCETEVSGRSEGSVYSKKIIAAFIIGTFTVTAFCKDLRRFTLVDSKAWSGDSSMLGWISNDEVIFRGSENLTYKPDDPLSQTTVSVWKLGKGITIHKRDVRQMCFVHVNLYYVTPNQQSKKYEQFFGPFGDEKAVQAGQVYSATCQLFPDGVDASRSIVPLSPDYGYLDRGVGKGLDSLKNTPVLLYKKGETKGFFLPFGRREMEGGVRYAAFKKSYLVTSEYFDPQTQVTSSPWPSELPRPLWWLALDGSVTKSLVIAPWNRSAQFYPTSVGLVISGDDERKAKPKITDIGLFLVSADGAVTKLAAGYARNIAISPDGCQVAFSHSEKLPPTASKYSVKVVQLCR